MIMSYSKELGLLLVREDLLELLCPCRRRRRRGWPGAKNMNKLYSSILKSSQDHYQPIRPYKLVLLLNWCCC